MNGLLQQEFEHGTKEFLRAIWYPTIGNFNFLHAEWEVRDFGNRCRYLDLATSLPITVNTSLLFNITTSLLAI